MEKGQLKHSLRDWKNKLKTLENVDLPQAKIRMGEAGMGGDWQENAEFEDAERQVDLIQTRIDEIKALIQQLKGKDKKGRTGQFGHLGSKADFKIFPNLSE